MPDTTKVSTENVTVNKEEKIVQRIVELLNEKGYEYERDARPIICWKYNVSSSKELSSQQKEEVKDALENGSFEKWGIEYRNQVLDQQVDIVKQIENLRESTEKIETEIKETIKQAEALDSKKIKINLNAKTTKTEPEPNKNEKVTTEPVVDGKISIPASERIKISTDKEKDKKNDKKLMESSAITIEPAEKGKTRIARKIKNEKEEAIKEPAVESSVQNKPEPENTENIKLKEVEEVNQELPEIAADISIPVQRQDIQDDSVQNYIKEEIKIPVSTRDRLKIDNQPNESVKMDIDEAKEIVKNCYASKYVEESSLFTTIIVILSLTFFGLSVYINAIILMNKNLPSWLKLICKIFE